MKKSYYQLYTKLYDDYYLWVNFMNNSHLILKTGAIVWNEKITTLGYDLTKDKCKQCKMYPSCLGPCTLHLMNGDETCFLESLNLSLSEYMMFLYKNEMIRKKVYEQ